MYTNTLLTFCNRIGVDAAQVKRAESIEQVSIMASVPCSRVRALTAKDVEDFQRVFGPAGSFAVGVADASPLLELVSGQLRSDPQRLAEFGTYSDGLNLEVKVEISKQTLLGAMFPQLDGCHHILYFFLDNLVKLLNAPLTDLDHILLRDAFVPTVVLVGDTDIQCKGSLLMIVSWPEAKPVSVQPPIPSHVKERIERFRNAADSSVNWSGFRLDHLTPIHLFCQCTKAPQGFSALITTRLAELLVLYSANRSSIEGRRIKAVYASSERSTELSFSGLALEGKQLQHVTRLASWLSSGQGSERLLIFQNVVARQIREDSTEENSRTFVQQLPRLLEDARWHYRTYVDGRITKHFEGLEAATTYVSGVAKQISDILDALTKSFVDSSLGSVGVLVLTLLAALVKSDTQASVFRVGVWAYAAYLFFFQLLYRMYFLHSSYKLTVDDSDQRLASFRIALGESKIASLDDSLKRRKSQFSTAFWLTVGLCLVVVIALVLAGFWLPPIIAKPGPALPSVSPTQTTSSLATARETPTFATPGTPLANPAQVAPSPLSLTATPALVGPGHSLG